MTPAGAPDPGDVKALKELEQQRHDHVVAEQAQQHEAKMREIETAATRFSLNRFVYWIFGMGMSIALFFFSLNRLQTLHRPHFYVRDLCYREWLRFYSYFNRMPCTM